MYRQLYRNFLINFITNLNQLLLNIIGLNTIFSYFCKNLFFYRGFSLNGYTIEPWGAFVTKMSKYQSFSQTHLSKQILTK